MTCPPIDMAIFEIKQTAILMLHESDAYLGWIKNDGMYEAKNIIPAAAAAELATRKPININGKYFLKMIIYI